MLWPLLGLLFGSIAALLIYTFITQEADKRDAAARAKSAGTQLPPLVPGSAPIFGHTLTIFKYIEGLKMFTYLEQLRKQYGNCFRMYRGVPLNLNIIYLMDPECIKHFLSTNFENYQRGHHRRVIMSPLFGDGIFTASGESWKLQRDTARPLFKLSNLETMLPVFTKHASMVVDKLGEFADTGTEVDIQQIFWRFTLDSIGQIAYGYNIDTLHDNPEGVQFAAAFDRVQRTIDRHFTLSLLRYLPSAENRQLARDCKLIDDFAYRIIRKTRERKSNPHSANEATGSPSLLDSFMQLRDERNGGKPYSDKFLRDIVLNFVVAGRDTTANLLTWMTYLVAQHPSVEQKLVAEIREKFPKDPTELTGNILKQMKYTEMVLEETLRLYPSVPIDGRQALKDDVLPNGMFVPKSSGVVYSAYILHRMKELWGEDAEEFKPERFGDNHTTKNKMHPYQYVPFHGGPQRCLGMKMAIMEAQVMTAYLFKHFEVSLVPTHPVEPIRAITFPAKNGVKVTLKRRVTP